MHQFKFILQFIENIALFHTNVREWLTFGFYVLFKNKNIETWTKNGRSSMKLNMCRIFRNIHHLCINLPKCHEVGNSFVKCLRIRERERRGEFSYDLNLANLPFWLRLEWIQCFHILELWLFVVCSTSKWPTIAAIRLEVNTNHIDIIVLQATRIVVSPFRRIHRRCTELRAL